MFGAFHISFKAVERTHFQVESYRRARKKTSPIRPGELQFEKGRIHDSTFKKKG